MSRSVDTEGELYAFDGLRLSVLMGTTHLGGMFSNEINGIVMLEFGRRELFSALFHEPRFRIWVQDSANVL